MLINRFAGGVSAVALMAADGVGSEAAPADAPPAEALLAAAEASQAPADAAPSPATEAKADVAAPTEQPAAVESVPETSPAKTESTSSLLEAAEGKPKSKEAEAKPADVPAPAEGKTADPPKEETQAKPEGDAPAKEALAEAQPPAPKTYDAFKLPEGVTLGDKELKAFTDAIGPAQVPQEVAQSLIDQHIAEIKRVQEAVSQNQRDVWNTLNDGWKTELKKDAELGGNRINTTLAIAKAVIEEFGGTPEQQQALLAHTSNNGMGNYIGFVRLLHNIGVALNVFEDSIVPANAPTPNKGKTRADRWYRGGNGASAP